MLNLLSRDLRSASSALVVRGLLVLVGISAFSVVQAGHHDHGTQAVRNVPQKSEYSLLDVYNLALDNDAQIRAAYEDKLVTQEGKTQAKAGLLPSMSLTASYQYNQSSVGTSGTDTSDDYYSGTWGATLKQPLFNLASWFGYKSSEFTSRQAQLTYEYEQQSLILRVAESYLNVLRAEDGLQTAIAQEKAVKQQLDQSRERFKVGLIAETDVLEARARYDSAKVTRIDNENNLSVAYEALRTITNQQIKKVGKLNKTMPVLRPTPADPEEWVKSAQAGNKQLQAAREGVESAKNQVYVQRSGHMPTVDAVASYNYSTSDSDSATGLDMQGNTLTGSSDQAVIGIQLSMPLYTGGLTKSRADQAYHQMESVQENYDKALREVHSGTRNFYRTVNSDVSRVEARCQGIVSSESALKATQSGYEVGTRNITDVLDAQNNLFVAERDYLNARYDFIVNSLNLKQAAGVLSPDDLIDLNSWIVPSKSASIPKSCRAR